MTDDTATEMRDPRTDPILLDHVGDRTVEYVTVFGTVIYSKNKGRRKGKCSLKAWRRWARHKKVVRVAPKLSRRETIGREYNLLRCRLPDGGGLSDEDIEVALVDLALGLLHHHSRPQDFHCSWDGLARIIHDERLKTW